MSLYLQDYDGAYPALNTAVFKPNQDHPNYSLSHGKSWSEVLLPYIQKNSTDLPRCPSADQDILPHSVPSYLTMGYAYNINLSEITTDRLTKSKSTEGKGEAQLPFDSLTVVFAEARLGVMALDGPDIDPRNIIIRRPLDKVVKSQRLGGVRHRGGANYAFADGHVRWSKPEALNAEKESDGKTPGFGL